MLYEVLGRIIGVLCLHTGCPLSAQRIAAVLDGLFDEDLVEGVCLRMQSEGKLFHVCDGAYTVRSMLSRTTYTQILVSREYQELGMTLMDVDNNNWARCIPPEAEHRFLEIKPSTIGGDSGMGLFVRHHRRIPLGCVFCEYRGRQLERLPLRLEQGMYVVHVRNTDTYIDGVSAEGEHLSLATFINDNGPQRANAEMMEYAKHPGRVFVVANRDIHPGEEVFVLYGATYWGFTSYSELARRAHQEQQLRSQQQQQPYRPHGDALRRDVQQGSQGTAHPVQATGGVRGGRKRGRAGDAATTAAASADQRSDDRGGHEGREAKTQHFLRIDVARACRCCGDLTIGRAAQLHSQHCDDPLVKTELMHLDCMPHNEYTAIDVPHIILSTSRTKALRRARALVSMADPHTFSHTHTDVIRDLEFTFEEADSTAAAVEKQPQAKDV